MRKVVYFIANAAGWLSRRFGRGGGTTLPGVVLLKLRPNAISEFAAEVRHGVILCSATNGKTTTTRLLGSALRSAGYRLVTNAEGSNLARGVASAFLHGDEAADLALFEVDEAALGPVATATNPSVVVLMNLFRDQLDRYGELETLLDKWRTLLTELSAQSDPPILVLNADDPNIADLGRDRPNVVWFGLDDTSHGEDRLDHAADATSCRRCSAALSHSLVFVGHLGHWSCPNCGLTRPNPTISGTRAALHPRGQTLTISYPATETTSVDVRIESALPGLHNSYNLTAAFAASYALAMRNKRPHEAHSVARALGATTPAFGRGERIEIGERSVTLLLAKNPTGVNQNVRLVMNEPEDLHLLVLLNDRTADGQDVSWIWDVDWEMLLGRVASLTLGGDRAWDLALRFRYGGFDMDRVKIAPDIEKALDLALTMPAHQNLYVLPTYTAMLDLRWVLTQRGYTSAYWNEAS